MIRNILSFIIVSCCLHIGYSQDLQYFFVEDTYQRSYTNPALLKEKTAMIASGLSTNIGTDGPVYNDLISKNEAGRFVLDVENGLENMSEQNNIFGGGSVHIIDASTVRCAGHTNC